MSLGQSLILRLTRFKVSQGWRAYQNTRGDTNADRRVLTPICDERPPVAARLDLGCFKSRLGDGGQVTGLGAELGLAFHAGRDLITGVGQFEPDTKGTRSGIADGVDQVHKSRELFIGEGL